MSISLKNKKNLISFIAIIFVVIASVAIIYVSSQDTKHDAKASAVNKHDKEIIRIIKKVEKLVDLPKSDPALTKIKDLESVSGQAFFENAMVGDYLLIYTEEKRAILYRESINEIIKNELIIPN